MTEKYWEEEIETMGRSELEKLQLERLKQTVAQASNSPYYKKLFAEKGLSVDSIQSLDDLKKFPFTTKDDLRNNYPFGLMAVPQDEVVRLHSSSGTTGNPTVVYSKRFGQLGKSGSALHVHGGRPQIGCFPKHIRVWNVYWRTWLSVWG